MANNRLYMYCKKCNESILLAKNFGSGYGAYSTVDEIDKFLNEHSFCEHSVILCEEDIHSGFSITDTELPEYDEDK